MKKSFYFLIFSIIIVLFIFVAVLIYAQKELPPEITFPIPELGNCASKTECEAFCDLPENMAVCLDFVEAHNLISREEIKMARKMLELGVTAGPGGCRGQAECEAYCDDISHIEECLAFAERHNLIPPAELEEGKKVAQAMKRGIRPPDCKNKTECDIYCSQPENMEECLTFGEAAGLIPPEELADAKKALEAIRKGVKPPPCRGKKECEIYCSQPENLEACLTFAEAAGFISPEEAAMARKTGGKGPGGCRGKEACEKYCDDPTHAEECIDFALKYGFMPPEEAENAKKMLKAGLTTGPGGCRGKTECEIFCNDIAHTEECVDFAVRAGFMKPEEAEMAKKMAQAGPSPGNCKGKEECETYCQDPAHSQECLDFAVRAGQMSPEEGEKARKGMEMMRKGGPGGCQSEAECKAYCQDPAHGEECLNFAIEQGIMSAEEAQRMREMMRIPAPEMGPPPGMPPPEGIPPEGMPSEGVPPEGIMPGVPCTSPEECMQYCFQNPTDPFCQAMMPPGAIFPQPPPQPGVPPQ